MLGYFPDIHTIQSDRSFCHIVKSRDQINQRRFSASGTSNDRCSLSRLCCKMDIVKHIFVRSLISKGYMFKFQDTFFRFLELCGFFRILNYRFACQDLFNTICRYRCSWKHDRDHTDHQESHDNLHRVLNKCHHISNLHLAVTDSMCSIPYDQHRNSIHDEHHGRHHKRHRTIDKQTGLRQINICRIKSFFLILFRTECPNHRKSCQNLPCHQIQLID